VLYSHKGDVILCGLLTEVMILQFKAVRFMVFILNIVDFTVALLLLSKLKIYKKIN